jgi:hypothetical protein
MRFTSHTIDQPGKAIAEALHGGWPADYVTIEDADCCLMVGMNPPISKIAPSNNPSRVLHGAVKRRLKLVVIDARRTETTRFAAVHLQRAAGSGGKGTRRHGRGARHGPARLPPSSRVRRAGGARCTRATWARPPRPRHQTTTRSPAFRA